MRIETERLVLRRWREEDLAPFSAMSADPQVMDWLGGVLSPEDARAYMDRSEASFDRIGMGRFALTRRSDGMFLGSCGLFPGREMLPIAPYVDIGWRLGRAAWGFGYASEAARAVAEDGFRRLGLTEILAVTNAENARSRSVMARIGFVHDPARDFGRLPDAPDWPEHSVVYAGSPG